MNTTVTEHTEHGDMPINIYHRLSNDRILFITNHIDDMMATSIVASLLLKDSEAVEEITLFINSEGGDLRNALMIIDTMNLISSPIKTVCIGSAMDEAALILTSGTPGLRFATQHATISVSQLVNDWMSVSDMTDAKTNLNQSMLDNKKIMEILAKCTGKPIKEVTTYFDRRVFMSGLQAAKYGLIDKLISPSK